jgi:hypothetical protein
MEHSSQGTDGPLLPVHNTPGQRPLSSGSGDPPTSPFLHPSQGQGGPVSRDGHHEEADIAESGIHGEKVEAASPTRRNTGNYKSASVEEEQQALDWIVPVQNGGMMEKRVSQRVSCA